MYLQWNRINVAGAKAAWVWLHQRPAAKLRCTGLIGNLFATFFQLSVHVARVVWSPLVQNLICGRALVRARLRVFASVLGVPNCVTLPVISCSSIEEGLVKACQKIIFFALISAFYFLLCASCIFSDVVALALLLIPPVGKK